MTHKFNIIYFKIYVYNFILSNIFIGILEFVPAIFIIFPLPFSYVMSMFIDLSYNNDRHILVFNVSYNTNNGGFCDD